MPGYQELIVIFLIVLLLFGGRKIPEIARGIGKGMREFRKARDDIHDAIREEGRKAESSDEDDDGSITKPQADANDADTPEVPPSDAK